jgi:hypothetical protein
MPSVALESTTFAPALRQISAITQANPAVVTTTFDHGYITGTIIRLYIPLTHGMQQAQHAFSSITVLGDTTFSMDSLNTITFDAFVLPAPEIQFAQCVPIGEINSILRAAFVNILREGG